MYAFSTSPPAGPALAPWRQVKHAAPLSVVILLHVVAVYAFLRGFSQHTAPPIRHEVFATFIVPEKVETEIPKSVSAPPAVPPMVQQVARPVAQAALKDMPAPQALSVPAPAASMENTAVAIAAASIPQEPEVVVQPRTLLSGIEYIQPPRPEYPAISRRLRESGDVTLRVLVNEQGKAEQIDIEKTSGSSRLDEAARQAIQRAIFKPHTEDGKAVAIHAIAVIGFNINANRNTEK